MTKKTSELKKESTSEKPAQEQRRRAHERLDYILDRRQASHMVEPLLMTIDGLFVDLNDEI